MPTYEFRCPKGHEFEKFYRSIGAAPSVVACPTCGAIAERQMSAGGGLVFKGSGFYITDYGKDGKKAQTAPVVAGEGSATAGGGESAAPKGEPKSGAEAKPSVEKKASVEAKPSEAKPSPSKSAAKKSSGRAKSSE
jgi:putative FmdB family regulatory protein